MIARWCILGGVLAAGFATPASSQVVPDRPACPRCTIRVVARGVLATAAAPSGLPGIPTVISRDRAGRFWVVTSGELPLVFDPRGAFLGEVGRKGDGPGEYRGIAAIAPLPGDSTLVVDARLQRASVLSPDREFVRALALPVRGGATTVLQWPRLVVMNGASLAPETAGWPLHLLDFSGNPVKAARAFGDRRGELRAGQTPALLRKTLEAEGARFWAAHVVRYELAEYDVSGAIVRTVVRRPAFFADDSEWSVGAPDTPPPPFLDAAAVRADTLWVAMRVPRPDWREAWKALRLPRASEISAARGPERTELYRSRIEVIDATRGRLVAATVIEGIVLYLGRDGKSVVYDLDPAGLPRLRIAELSLTGH
ncbi:MAG: hypothetical protein FIB01_05385 [Gemmatimonadetes bacterium]|nr:hypothetical protein [Gemmatimonadota bacterium]